jgi:gliding motility-associated-like protein
VASVLVFGGGFIEYLWSNGAIIATIDNLSAGIYTVTVTRHYPTYNCTASTTVVITNAYTPAISVTTTNALCGLALGSAGVIISNAPVGITFTYHWSNGATTTTATGLAPNFGGLAYGVTVTPSTGCNSSQSFDILNTGTPIDVLTGQHPSICGLANGTLTALATSPGTLTWSNGATGSSVPNVAAGTYTVTATNGTCSSTTSIAVVNSPTPIINANINNGTCGLSNGSIAIQPKTHITPTYLWSNGTTTNSIDNLTAGTYTVTVSLGATCSTTSSFTIINPATFSATTTARPTSCDTLTGSVNTIPFSNANLLFNYKWSNAATTQEITNLPAGIYTVTITANNGCTLTQSATILSPISPIAAYFANNPIISQGPQTPLNVLTNMPVNNYVWSNGATSNPITVTPIANTIYTVTVSLATGCSGTASVFVIVNDVKWNIPTVFTPNGDGENDTYYIVQYGSLEVLSFQIYNRWGELLHDKSSKPWDGKKEDVPQPIDTYVYKVIVKYPDSITETRVGDFLLLR